MQIGLHDLEQKVFIIAELSANHNQDFALAKEAVRLAHEAGADAIKLQTYTPDSLTLDIKDDRFKASDLWQDEYLYDLYARACMPYEWHLPLKTYADTLGITFFSSPFDHAAVNLLASLDVPAYKIASFEITDIPLIAYAASKGKPMIISTGIAEIEDIQLAIDTCYRAGNHEIVLLKCTSAYPALPETMNLLTIPDMQQRFNLPVGLSDHTLGLEAVIASVALGARVIEKHFTPDKSVPSADRDFSLDFHELKTMVQSIRTTEKLLGSITYSTGTKTYARSLYAAQDIAEGEPFTSSNVKSIRPGDGLHPKYYEKLIQQRALHSITRGSALKSTDWKITDL